MSLGDRFFSLLLYVTGVLFVAGLVHIVSISRHAACRARMMPIPAFRGAREAGQDDIIAAGSSPAMRSRLSRIPPWSQAVCLYDLADGPLHVHADLPDNRLLTISFRTRTGEVFYSMTDRASLHGTIDVHDHDPGGTRRRAASR